MKFIDEYRDKDKVSALVDAIRGISVKEARFMEVCGGHTMAIQKFGIPSLLPENIKLLSGPGCPVCVSSRSFIDQAIAYSRLDNTIVATYGDLIRVPGSTSSLEKEKAKGKEIKIVYSALDAIELAKKNPTKNVVFLGIGFETTAPGNAAAIQTAFKLKLSNFFLFSSHKIMPPAMEAIVTEGVKIDGYIAPGHVSAITGSIIYEKLLKTTGIGSVISGFEPVDVLQSVYLLVKQLEEGKPDVEIQYKRAVLREGNLKALQIMDDVFELRDDWWRGLGVLQNSGLKIRDKYSMHDAEVMLKVEVEETKEEKGCICGDILKGLSSPQNCKLFGKVCVPENPVGACMVSNEGACHAHYRYKSELI